MNSEYKRPEGITKEQWRELLHQWVNAEPLESIGHRQIRAVMSGLTIECPFGGNPSDCCLHEIRKIPFGEREKWVSELSEFQIETIYRKHVECSRFRRNAG